MRRFGLVLGVLWMSMNAGAEAPKPPVAKQVPHEMKAFGDTRQDPYFWMRYREDPAVLEYVKAENAFTAETMKPMMPLLASSWEDASEHPGLELWAPFEEALGKAPFFGGDAFSDVDLRVAPWVHSYMAFDATFGDESHPPLTPTATSNFLPRPARLISATSAFSTASVILGALAETIRSSPIASSV